MKNLIFIIIIIIGIFTTACSAQKPVAQLNDKQVKVSNVIYNIQNNGDKYISVKNTNNKLTNVKQVAPNLPSDIKINYNIKMDMKLITQICANAIPLSTLKKLPIGINDRLSISLKVDTKGYPLESEFIIKNTSLLTANDLRAIEQGILNSQFKVFFLDGIDRFFNGANYFIINIPVPYVEILKAKENN